MIDLHTMTTYDREISTREAFVQEAASFVSFFPRVGSAGRMHGKDIRQAAVRLKNRIRRPDARVRPPGQPKIQPAGHGGLTLERPVSRGS